MGKLHKIRRFLSKPENRKKINNFREGIWINKRGVIILTYSNRYRKYIKKLLREYSAL